MLTRNSRAGKVPEAPMARWWMANLCHSAGTRDYGSFSCQRESVYFTAKNFHTISTDTHIDNMVIVQIIYLRGAHKNAAGTVHLETLLDHYLLVALWQRREPPSRRHNIRQRSPLQDRRRCRNHARVQTSFWIDGLAANKVNKLSARFRHDSPARSRSRRSLSSPSATAPSPS